MGAVDFSHEEADAAVGRRNENPFVVEEANAFFSLRDLLTAAGDGDGSSAVAAAAIAHFIRTGARQTKHRQGLCDFVHACWHKLVDMVLWIPHDHPWHAAFVGAVHLLYALGDEPIYAEADMAFLGWNTLSGLEYCFWDFWDAMGM